MSRTLNLSRVAVATEISLLVAASLVAPTWTAAPAWATIAEPALVSSVASPSGVLIDSPWITDFAGTQWAYGTTPSASGTLVSRNPITGMTTTTSIYAGDEGSLAVAYSPLTNVAVFSARRSGIGNRMVAFDLSTGTRISTRTLAIDESNIRAITFNSTAAYYLIGTNTNPAKILKVDVATGSVHSSATLANGLKEISAFIPNGTDAYAAVNTSPIKLVSFSKSTLAQGSTITLPASVPTVLNPVVVGTVAFLGTDASPGRVTAFDLTTKTVIGSVAFSDNETGARHLVADAGTGMLYAITSTVGGGERIVSIRMSDLARMGSADVTATQPVTSLIRRGHRLDVSFAGDGGVQTLSVAPEPASPQIESVVEGDGSLMATWIPGPSDEPILDYTLTATGEGQIVSCTTSDTECELTGLVNGRDYEISITARSLAGSSTPATSTGNPYTYPAAMEPPLVTRGDGSLVVAWTNPASGGRDITGFTATAQPGGQSCVTADTTCEIAGLTNGVTYRVTVVARNAAGESAPSDPSAAVTPATIPGSPENLAVEALDGGANVSWSAPTNDGGETITGYCVRVWVEASVLQTIESTDLAEVVAGLSNGTEHRFTVTALNAMGESESSTPTWVTPVAPSPPAPEPPVVEPPLPPVTEPPVVEPPVVEPPIVEPPIVEPPIVEPPVEALAPMSPTAITVLARTRSHVTVGWVIVDPGSFPVTDYRIETSRFKDRRFSAIADAVDSTPWLKIRKPRRGALFIRVIAVNAAGESHPSGVRRVVRG